MISFFLLSFLVLRDKRTRLGGYHSQAIYGPAKILNHIWRLLPISQPSPQSPVISPFVPNLWPSVKAIVASI